MHSALRQVAACLVIALSIPSAAIAQDGGAPAVAQADAAKPPPAAPPLVAAAEAVLNTFKEPPPVMVVCRAAKDVTLFGKLSSGAATPGLPTPTLRQAPTKLSDGTCVSHEAQESLVGMGSIEIGISAASWRNIQGYQKSTGKPVSLFLDGMDIGRDAELESIEERSSAIFGKHAVLTFRLRPGVDLDRFWRALYAERAEIYDAVPVSALLGWDKAPAPLLESTAPARPLDIRVAITDSFRFWCAIGLTVVLGVLSLLFAWRGDALRDAATPSLYADALRLRQALSVPGPPLPLEQRVDAEFGLAGGESATNHAAQERYRAAARDALTIGVSLDMAPEEKRKAQIGLVLSGSYAKPPRASYSLARIQLAVWFVATIAYALYLWIILGDLPPISGSALALLGISLGTTAASVSIDQSGEGRPFRVSQGLVKDITTGFNDKSQVSRYQSIVVNLMLLFTAFFYVLENLTFPTFDATWLAMLGLSGAALTVGKELTDPTKK